MMGRGAGAGFLLAGAILSIAGTTLDAQGMRGSVRTTTRYLEAQPILQDTVSRARVTERPDGGLEFEGYPVFCVSDLECVFYRSQPAQSAMVLYQDAEATAWGFGVQGLSATVQFRARARLGGDFIVPRSEDTFDAVLAYLELNRESYRLRLGRQRVISGLGATGFDGLDALYQVNSWLRVQGFGGRSLARGLNEPRQTAFRGLDDELFLPGGEAVVAGAELGLEPAVGTALALRYQMEIWSDRRGMISERASLTGRSAVLAPVSLIGAADYDFAFGRIGKAHLTAQLPLARNRLVLEATGRRYVPYFELWTIWGFFNPVAHHEALLRTTWRASPGATIWAAGGYRRYDDTDVNVLLEPLRNEAWRAEVGGHWRLRQDLTLSGAYRWEGPVGAFLTSGDATLAWSPTDRVGVALNGALFQQAEEFRIGDGTVLGGGGSVDLQLWSGASLAGGLDVYRYVYTDRPSTVNWNQLRGWTALQIGFGTDPGARRQRRTP